MVEDLMIDGTAISSETRVVFPRNPGDLIALGWLSFEVSDEDVDDIVYWLDVTISDFYSWDINLSLSVVSIRCYDDAVLFKLTWPECESIFLI